MIDKFQKLFGPNPPRGSEAEPQSAGVEPLQFADALGDEAQKKRMQRIRNKRRILGFAAFVLAFLIAAPTFFEPDNTYADRTAKTLIPPLEDVKPAAVVKISQTEEAAKNLREPPASQSAVDSAAKSLSRANPVTASASLAAGSETPASAAKNDEKPVRKAGVVSEEKPREAAAKKTEPVKTAKAADAKPAAGKKTVAGPYGITASETGRYYIQIIATANQKSALEKVKYLKRLGLPAYAETVKRRNSDLWRVRVGRFATLDDAKAARDLLALNSESHGGISQLPAKK
ncbi:SPOR domain-containing protein [Duodenibacillus massiliensis]|uniref:SPOR domain-containing protein n=1 Tax=Duodenibacillus massiliensis TaxID=1852381 RepID=UPI0023A7ED37|nr:SPOR domain-containing protein [Duodenibacillus massiliensis]